jgi:hypothetical protein
MGTKFRPLHLPSRHFLESFPGNFSDWHLEFRTSSLALRRFSYILSSPWWPYLWSKGPKHSYIAGTIRRVYYDANFNALMNLCGTSQCHSLSLCDFPKYTISSKCLQFILEYLSFKERKWFTCLTCLRSTLWYTVTLWRVTRQETISYLKIMESVTCIVIKTSLSQRDFSSRGWHLSIT